MDHLSRRARAYARIYGPLTAVTAVSTILAVWAELWLSVPIALVFLVFAYLWSLDMTYQPYPAERGLCPGCRAGCVGCRERIDIPVTEPRKRR